jgi:hypothetical protein
MMDVSAHEEYPTCPDCWDIRYVPEAYHPPASLETHDYLCALPFEIRDRIWKLVFTPIVIFSVLTPPRKTNNTRERVNYRDCIELPKSCYGDEP